MRPRQNGRHFPYDIFKCISLNENVWIPIKISMKFVPKCPINHIPALVQIMAWHRLVDKPLSEPMMVSLTSHICVTQPQWVKTETALHPWNALFRRCQSRCVFDPCFKVCAIIPTMICMAVRVNTYGRSRTAELCATSLQNNKIYLIYGRLENAAVLKLISRIDIWSISWEFKLLCSECQNISLMICQRCFR